MKACWLGQPGAREQMSFDAEARKFGAMQSQRHDRRQIFRRSACAVPIAGTPRWPMATCPPSRTFAERNFDFRSARRENVATGISVSVAFRPTPTTSTIGILSSCCVRTSLIRDILLTETPWCATGATPQKQAAAKRRRQQPVPEHDETKIRGTRAMPQSPQDAGGDATSNQSNMVRRGAYFAGGLPSVHARLHIVRGDAVARLSRCAASFHCDCSLPLAEENAIAPTPSIINKRTADDLHVGWMACRAIRQTPKFPTAIPTTDWCWKAECRG